MVEGCGCGMEKKLGELRGYFKNSFAIETDKGFLLIFDDDTDFVFTKEPVMFLLSKDKIKFWMHKLKDLNPRLVKKDGGVQ